MREFKRPQEIALFSQRAKNHGKKIGFIPTMGTLHEGHLSLVTAAKRQCEVVIVSIFVNPIQFGPSEDFARYPRQPQRDKKLLKNHGVDALFIPEASVLLPPEFRAFVDVEALSKKMCGRSRPTHFRGVTTIVSKFFNLIQPDLAFFGEKDFQQQLIIKQMVRDLNFPVEIVTLPTVREFDGLALSSRNRFLQGKERETAAILYKALCLAQREINNGERDLTKIIFRMRSLIGSEPIVRLDYLVAVDPSNLEEMRQARGKVLFALAAYVGKTRLIDNLTVEVR